jgi:phosphate transport system protein
MPKQFDQELDELTAQLITMNAMVVDMFDNTKAGLIAWDTAPFADNKSIEEKTDQFQREIDDHTINMMAVYTPVASDLRLLLMVTRITAELERIGYQLANVNFYAKQMFKEPAIKPLVDIPRMIDIGKEMLMESMTAFKEASSEQALAVIKKDDKVDELNDQIFRELMTYVISKPNILTQAIELMLTARAFERIADHTVNIAEDVYFMVEGYDIRHISLNDIEKTTEKTEPTGGTPPAEEQAESEET